MLVEMNHTDDVGADGGRVEGAGSKNTMINIGEAIQMRLKASMSV